MSNSRQQLGRRGEELARTRLEKMGYTVLEANHRSGSGEIDVVAEHEGTLVFVEVRTRRGNALGTPEESITPRKRSRMVDAAQTYLQAKEAEDREWRIDLVAVEMGFDGRLQRIDVLQNVVEL
jgi:putative endonuclease